MVCEILFCYDVSCNDVLLHHWVKSLALIYLCIISLQMPEDFTQCIQESVSGRADSLLGYISNIEAGMQEIVSQLVRKKVWRGFVYVHTNMWLITALI